MVLLLILINLVLSRPDPAGRELQVITGKAQGTTYSIKYISRKARIPQASIDSIFRVIDLSLSLYEPASLINTFNLNGKVLMDAHMKKVVLASISFYRASAGSFDITTAGLSALWGFGSNRQGSFPTNPQISRQLERTGSRHLLVKGDSLVALREGVSIDCNGIAQGYTVDVLFNFLRSWGIKDLLVELGGEIRVGGEHPGSKYWHIGIESASAIAGEWRPANETIRLKEKAVTTSGNYRNLRKTGGVSYSHIIDPQTGKPVDNGTISVTVIADDAMTADAWDNALFVMGPSRAKEVLGGFTQIDARITYIDETGMIRQFSSKGFVAHR